MAERLLGARVVALGTAALLALVVAVALADQTALGAIGPGALRLAWLPLALSASAAAADQLGRPRAGTLLALGARLGVWVVLLALFVDPRPNAPDAVAAALHVGMARLGSAVRAAISALVGVLVLGGLAAILLGGGSSEPKGAEERRPTAVRTGSSLGPMAAVSLRLTARLGLVGAVTAAWVLLVLVAWTLRGAAGVGIALGIREPVATPDLALARIAGLLGRVGTGITDLLARRASTWGRQQVHGVWLSPAATERGPNGELLSAETWVTGAAETDEDRELRELANGFLAALDVVLLSGTLKLRAGERDAGDPRAPGPRACPYRLEVARAWTRPTFHALVIRATPTTANALLARATVDMLLPTLDAETSWTAGDLKGLRLSDGRVAQDPLRGGERGIFVALDRVTESEPELVAPSADPGRAAVDRALREAGLVARFRFESADANVDADVIEYRASFSTSAEWRELEASWRGLQPAVALFARSPGARLDTTLDPYGFVCTLPKEAPEFPSGEATDWTKVVTRLEPTLRRRHLAFVLGLDHQGQPLILELGTETPHLLLAGGTGSGKSRALLGSIAQLLWLNSPDRLRIFLLDSVKRELTAVIGEVPHIERSVIAEDGNDVVTLLERFSTAMNDQYLAQAGMEFDPSKGPAHLLVIEEWADLRDLLDRDQLERVIRAVNRIGQLGRAAGFHLIIVTQKASAEIIPPRLKTNFKGRIAGYLPSASDYGILFDQHRRLLPNVKGRLAVSTDGHEVKVVQALFIDNSAIRELVADLRQRNTRPLAFLPPQLEAAEPRAPTAREIEGLDILTLARLIYRWQAELDEPLVVSVRLMVDRVRALGYTPGRVERYTAGLAELEVRGVLERTGDGPQSPRRLTGMPWSSAVAVVQEAA